MPPPLLLSPLISPLGDDTQVLESAILHACIYIYTIFFSGIEMEFYINISEAPEDIEDQDIVYPRFNYPANPGVQLAIHSPNLALSPFSSGMAFSCGKLYQIKLEQVRRNYFFMQIIFLLKFWKTKTVFPKTLKDYLFKT